MSIDNSSAIEERLEQLRRDFRRDLVAVRATILNQSGILIHACEEETEEAKAVLAKLAHRLAGSGEVFGHPGISAAGRELEEAIDRPREQTGEIRQKARAVVAQIDDALREADGSAEAEEVSMPIEEDRSIRITYVEDEPDIREIGRISLEDLGGFTVDTCADGYEALSRGAEFQPDLIILDVMMPGIDGIETYGKLREIPSLQQTPIVFMTARVQDEEVAKYRALGCAEVIYKPFDPVSLHAQVAEVWRRSGPRQATPSRLAS